MTASLIDGRAIARELRADVAREVAALKKSTGMAPVLAAIMVGDDPASQSYLAAKGRACTEAGIGSIIRRLPSGMPQDEVEALIRRLSDDPAVNAILLQLPVPPEYDEQAILNEIRIEKDVDGLHPANIGRLFMKGRTPLFVACTPAGCMELLARCGVRVAGAHAAVIGRSNIVGIPIAALLNNADATVTLCHSRTPDLPDTVRRADIVVAAIGRPGFVRGDWIRPGATVIDVGINRVPDASAKFGTRLVGDVAFDEARQVAAAITPVPGGVGPMTIAMLLRNTVRAFVLQHGLA